MKIRTLSWVCAVLYLALGSVPVQAAPMTVTFSAVVTQITNHPSGETWGGRLVPLGTVVAGSYTYEPFPSTSNPFQIINGSFEFSAGALSSAGTFLNIAINRLGESPNYHGGDRYRPNSSRNLGFFCGQNFCDDTFEAFWVDLETMSNVLPPNPITTLPDFTLFDRHVFHYQISNKFGRLEIDADLTSLAFIPEPGTLALFGLGLAGLGVMRRRRERTGGPL